MGATGTVMDGTLLHRALGRLARHHDVLPLFYGGCCEVAGEEEGMEGGPLDGEVGFVFWHDGSVHAAALTGWLGLECRAFVGTERGDRAVVTRLEMACREVGMATRRCSGHRQGFVHVQLDAEDREWFEGLYDDDLEEMLESREECRADRQRERTLYKSFFEGVRRWRADREALRRRCAGRVIGEAMVAWACRPGGPATAGAKRSFEAISASGTR